MKRASRLKSLAQEKYKSPINNSKSKVQYSFSKAARFPRRNYSSASDIKFYDLPSQKSDRKTTFGYGQRNTFNQRSSGPQPNKYNTLILWNQNKRNFQFGQSRQNCKANQTFTTNNNPGPGSYDPSDKLCKTQISFSMRQKNTNPKEKIIDTPGPIYKIDSTLADQKKFLSIYVKRNSTKMYPPTKKSQPQKKEQKERPKTQCENRIVNSKGWKEIGKNCKSIFMSTTKRFIDNPKDVSLPGPGAYQSFSEFVEESTQ